jgi:bifunctional non-homologous end joining protein LigD
MRADRELFPETGFSMSDAVAYYDAIAPFLLPHLKNVPVSFKRYVDTIHGESFWEKDAPSFTPDWVKTVAVPRRGGDSDIHYILINNRRTLRWVVESGGIEIHPFLHRAPHIERATAMVFDLDPGEGAGIVECCDVALLLRDALTAIHLESLAKVSGSKGLQLYVPLNGRDTHDATQSLARLIADELARANPKLIVSKMAKHLRARKVFIDWSQNADFKTTVAVYSLRAKRDAPFVSMPVTWAEVERARGLDFTPDQAVKRASKRGDLFAPVLKLKQKLPVAIGGRRAASGKKEKTSSRTQSGRHTFVLMRDEIWLENRGKFKRWILRPDREGGPKLIAMPAGEFKADENYLKRFRIEDRGVYEIIEGSEQRRRLRMFFSGKKLNGEWILEKPGDDTHRSWTLAPG